MVVKIGSALVVDQDEAAPRTAWLDGVAADIASLRARGADVIVVSSGAIALARRSLGLHAAPAAAGGAAGRRRGRTDPPGPGLERGAVGQGPHRRAAAADARRHRGPPPLSECARHAEHAARPRLHPGDQRERHRRHHRDPLRRQRPPRRARRRDDRRPTSWCCCPTSTVSTPPIRAAIRAAEHIPLSSSDHARDRGDGWRTAARLLVRRHAHQAGRRAHRHPGRLCDGDRAMATPTIRLPHWRRARAAPGSSPHRKAVPHASAGSPARSPRSARWWWTPAPRALLPSDVRCCRPACAAVEGTFQRGDPVVVRERGRQGVGTRPLRLRQRRCRTHRRPSLRRDRGNTRLARPRRDHPPRRPCLALNAIAQRQTDAKRNVRRCTSRPKPPSICNAPRGAARAASHVLARALRCGPQCGAACDGRRRLRSQIRGDPRGQRRRPRRLHRDRRVPRPAGADRGARRCDGQGPGGHRAAARSARPHAGRLDAAERAAHPAHRHADRRDRHDLREPPQCRRRCRRHLPEVGQRGDPARRLGERAQRRRDQRRAGRRAAQPRDCRKPACRSRRTPTAPMSPRCWPPPDCST